MANEAEIRARALQLQAQAKQKAARAGAERPMTLQERSEQVYDFDNLRERGTLLPVGETQEGEFTFAVPQILKDLAESALLPGHVLQGGSYTPQDATRFALNYLVPATQHSLTGAAPAGRRALTEGAPSTQQLKTAAGSAKGAAKGSGVVVNETGQKKLLQSVAKIADDEAVTPGLHDKVVRVIGRMVNRAAKTQDVQELIRQRQLLQGVARTGNAEEQRIASRLIGALDNYIDNLGPDDLAEGVADEVGANLKQFRALWTRAKKSEQVESIVQAAQSQASGFENGLRIGFRRILKDPKLSKGWTKDELKIMQEIVEGTSKTKLLRLLGKLSFGTRGGSNFLGGAIGVYSGGTLAGPLGSAASPVLGYGAQKGVDRAQMNAAQILRALAARGGQVPKEPISRKALANFLLRGAGPTVAAQRELERRFPQDKSRNVTEENVDEYLIPGLL